MNDEEFKEFLRLHGLLELELKGKTLGELKKMWEDTLVYRLFELNLRFKDLGKSIQESFNKDVNGAKRVINKYLEVIKNLK